jgi:hypothetical protein
MIRKSLMQRIAMPVHCAGAATLAQWRIRRTCEIPAEPAALGKSRAAVLGMPMY